MNIRMITLNQSTKTKENYITWILTALLFICKLKIFMTTLLVMLKSQKLQQGFKSDHHNEEINKIALSSNDEKGLQPSNKTTMYLHGTNVFKICKSEMIILRSLMLENYTYCPFYYKIILQSRQNFKSLYRTR